MQSVYVLTSYVYPASTERKLECVRNQVQKDLLDSLLIGANHVALVLEVLEILFDLHPRLLGLVTLDSDHVLDQGHDVQVPAVLPELTSS